MVSKMAKGQSRREALILALAVFGLILTAGQEAGAVPETDGYGGVKSVTTRATGFFRTEQIQGRWWLITPEGHGFISAGINHVDYREDYSPAFVRLVASRLRDWGFNTIGWSQESLTQKFVKGGVIHSKGWGPEQYREAQMPYTHLIRFTDIEWYTKEAFPDVFSPEFAANCDQLARDTCLALRDDPFLIGYFYADTPNWPLWAQRLGADKVGPAAARYYSAIREAIRRYDPNHLLLGDRFKADAAIPLNGQQVRGVLEPVLRAAAGTTDILSLEYYRADDDFEQNLERWSRLAGGKPVLLADSAFLAPTDALEIPASSPLYVKDQTARGEKYKSFAARVYANPLVVGWHWCAFGRSKGRRSGLLDGTDQPYEECVSRMRDFNRNRLYPVAFSARSASLSDSRTQGVRFDPDAQRDQYGGTEAIQTKATGFFRVEQIDGRWWFVTPEGHPFISMGMNHFDLSALKHADNIDIFRQRYGGDSDRFIQEGIAEPLRKWGFNTIGWTQESVCGRWLDPKTLTRHSNEWSPREFKVAGMPYVYNLHFADIEMFNSNPYYPDVFDPDFELWADYVARSVCVDVADDPLLIGYADVTVPAWTSKVPGAWAENLDLEKPADREKLEEIVRRYFEVTTQAIRRYDKNHLIFGPRFDHPPNTPHWIIKMAGAYFDALLCNLFVTVKDVDSEVKQWNELSGKPVVLSDMAFLAPTELLKVRPGTAAYVPDQKARGEAYQEFSGQILARPFIIGFHWCAYLENRARKSGIKNYKDEPYQDCVERMQEFNLHRVYQSAFAAVKKR